MSGLVLGGALLLGFGLLFNRLVGWLQRRGIGDFTAWQVIAGVLVILAVQAVAAQGRMMAVGDWTLLSLGYFACAGGPMAWGSWRRRNQ